MDTTIRTDPWIWVQDNVLPDDYCDYLVNTFEKEAAKGNTHEGETGASLVRKGKTMGDHIDGVPNDNIKQSDDLKLEGDNRWTEDNNVLSKTLQPKILEYLEYTENAISLPHKPIGFVETRPQAVNLVQHQGALSGTVTDTGFQIQRTKPHHGYGWHTDFWVDKQIGIRIITFIFYLNTVREGWTQFWNGDQIQPQKGRLLLFPSTATYYHQGYPPLDTKYIITGWLHKAI